ncbi:hypothetical protein Pmani_033317 [Petrolisthes manimaculis]|uniref:Uncharacterized protein n=1 Tax=Petrolisthes manimaculis TaxID=1843537 RepID=A0AAE1NRI5_9EUCA|nr:hypothetical protein Pmani_033317 [Petrolisthes manimaculis]
MGSGWVKGKRVEGWVKCAEVRLSCWLGCSYRRGRSLALAGYSGAILMLHPINCRQLNSFSAAPAVSRARYQGVRCFLLKLPRVRNTTLSPYIYSELETRASLDILQL